MTSPSEVIPEVPQRSEVDVEPRRMPSQERSRRRFDAMLDAFAALLGEIGFEAINTHLVAERAGVPVGTLYQFFPNKYALATALSRRYGTHFSSLVGERLSIRPEDAPWEEVYDRLLDAVAGLLFADESLIRLWAITQIVPELKVAREEADKLVFNVCNSFLAPYLSNLSEEELSVVVRTFGRTVYALLFNASQEEGERRAETVREMKRLVHAYVHSYMPAGE